MPDPSESIHGCDRCAPSTDGRFALDFKIPAQMVDGRWLHKDNNELEEVELSEMRAMFFCEVVLSTPTTSGHCTVMALISDSCDVAFCNLPRLALLRKWDNHFFLSEGKKNMSL